MKLSQETDIRAAYAPVGRGSTRGSAWQTAHWMCNV